MDGEIESASERNLQDVNSVGENLSASLEEIGNKSDDNVNDDSGICANQEFHNQELPTASEKSECAENEMNGDDVEKMQAHSDSGMENQEGVKRTFINTHDGLDDENEPSTSSFKKRYRSRNYRNSNMSSSTSSSSSPRKETSNYSDAVEPLMDKHIKEKSADDLPLTQMDTVCETAGTVLECAVPNVIAIPTTSTDGNNLPSPEEHSLIDMINTLSQTIRQENENHLEENILDLPDLVDAHESNEEFQNPNALPAVTDEETTISSIDSEIIRTSDDNSTDIDHDFSNADSESSREESTKTINEVLNAPKPNYAWHSFYEIMRREHGLDGRGQRTLRNGMSTNLNHRFCSSRHVIERMELSHKLSKHNGCVNCLNFNTAGDILCSGSDDLRIILWNWAANKPIMSFKSGHTENIFQTKFLPHTGSSEIISASRDGQVRRSYITPGCGKARTVCEYKHNGSVHKLVLSPNDSHQIISVGEDGYIRQKDLRSNDCEATVMLKVLDADHKKRVRLFSISHNPFKPEICVSGCDSHVRVYDKRNFNKTVYEMYPRHLEDPTMSQVTCAVYNSTGSEILASYSDDYIYLFNNLDYKEGEFLHSYKGHYNYKTIKGVNFFGPNSEYIISGSDCGNIYFWDKQTEAILNVCPGDDLGVVNCLEPHPCTPVLATSGLDSNIKIWTPSNSTYPPDLTSAKKHISRNIKRNVISDGVDERRFQYLFRQFLRHSTRSSNNSSPEAGYATSSSDSDSEDNVPLLACHPQ
ncbi:DDB1- and CUL4-associated factor 8 [Teleopsis dalmanni]|uniref:DDB1- and CUL4-associated factor 8 n=1 Tax=Teleopsis dalmanni TaxID=139649 RepID=UPI0018CFEA80|nr:DDB1- and CUL4-associated factor 8 [Teleopsis dalmanni]XP_037930937.1 DDB1- and CUL4-associated factor 8 [Teleopsis dalmanni]XP_037930943.1 DDB1- and CUL4-associated factor 8 [Teleopsis dalmanni]XP_037930948.1 DDB1- and CUL4-associated factor 8 [Teleopsis dalmanni]